MSNALTNFLTNDGSSLFKGYSHATGLYVNDTYARAPKLGFLYFVSFNINPDAVLDKTWLSNGRQDVGLLVKNISLPKFTIKSEMNNQYNRKTQVQTQLTYDPVSMDFHDDNSEITNGLWKNYYKYYYADSKYGDQRRGLTAYDDTKYGTTDNSYGLDSFQKNPFFNSIEIYVLHRGKFTQMVLVNPKITMWEHDKLDQDNGLKSLVNKMTVVYEDVLYYQGEITQGDEPVGFAANYYDTAPSPLSVGGTRGKSRVTSAGTLPNKEAVFGYGANDKQNLKGPTEIVRGPSIAPSVSQLKKTAANQNGIKITVTGLGGIQISGGQQFGNARLGFNIFSGRSGVHSTLSVQAGPVKLTTKK